MSIIDQSTTDFLMVGPDDPGYDAARATFNVMVDQRPAGVAFPATDQDVVAAVRYARERDLRVVPQTTTHNAGPLGDLADALLVKTSAMKGVEIDARARTARVRAGAIWEDVIASAAEHGLAALHGSSPDVGVVGYSLGGGMGWYARKHGLQTNHVTAIELVTAEGEMVRANADREPELFWALRGGGGNFGVVTAIEFRLFPITEVYAGALFFEWERAGQVLRTWNELLPDLPDEITSVGRLLQVPPMPEIPEVIRGKSFAVVEAAYLGDRLAGESLLAPLRELGPAMDTFAMVPATDLAELHMDPRDPMPAVTSHELVGALPTEAIDALVAAVGPGSGSPLVSVELRHLGGALGRSAGDHGARDTLAGELCMFAVGVPIDEAAAASIGSYIARLIDVLQPHVAGSYLNFVETPFDAERAFTPEAWRRLLAVKADVDPEDVFRANHPITDRSR